MQHVSKSSAGARGWLSPKVSLDDVDARVEALPSRNQALWRELRDVPSAN